MVKHAQQEVDYRLSKWLIWNAGKEQLLTPDEVENVFRELLSFYDPLTRSIENVCSFPDNPLGKYQNPTREEGDLHV